MAERYTAERARAEVDRLLNELGVSGADDSPRTIAVVLCIDRELTPRHALASLGYELPEPEPPPTVPFSEVPVGERCAFNGMLLERIAVPLGAHSYRGRQFTRRDFGGRTPNAFCYASADGNAAPTLLGGLLYIGPDRQVRPLLVGEVPLPEVQA